MTRNSAFVRRSISLTLKEWLTQMIRVSRELSGALRSNSLKLRIDALSPSQSLLREQRP